MKLKLFDFIDETLIYYRDHLSNYRDAEKYLKGFFGELYNVGNNEVLSLRTRIKNEESLKEKLLRKNYYHNFDNPTQAIKHLPDLIGITLQCRFIRNEPELYQYLFPFFKDKGNGWFQSADDGHVYLNLAMRQPQLQRNGFTIYRIDGCLVSKEEPVNFELQIKSLVHNFWNQIEHEVVYKNPDFIMYDKYNKAMLAAIRENLETVDRQLEIMYKEISYESESKQIGMNEGGFKIFAASSINELVNRKMKESIGFATDFKKCSAMLAQYIYINYFINSDNSRDQMISFLEHLNYLNANPINFTEELKADRNYIYKDEFCTILGSFFTDIMNRDFNWHVFFSTLFLIQPDDEMRAVSSFCLFMKKLIFSPKWFADAFPRFSPADKQKAKELIESQTAFALTDNGTTAIVHEDNIYKLMAMIPQIIKDLEKKYEDYASFANSRDDICSYLRNAVASSFY